MTAQNKDGWHHYKVGPEGRGQAESELFHAPDVDTAFALARGRWPGSVGWTFYGVQAPEPPAFVAKLTHDEIDVLATALDLTDAESLAGLLDGLLPPGSPRTPQHMSDAKAALQTKLSNLEALAYKLAINPKPHAVRILWGDHAEGRVESRTLNEYGFATEAEADAFLLGVDEATGCSDYELLLDDQKGDGTPMDGGEGGDEDDGESLQESPKRKAAWFDDMVVQLPIGLRVVVLSEHADSGEPEEKRQVGMSGIVCGYHLGGNGTWPWIRVTLSDGVTDGFYEEHLKILDTMPDLNRRFPCESIHGHPLKLAVWLKEAKRVFPIGSVATVVEAHESSSDLIGQSVTVIGYHAKPGEEPTIKVRAADGTSAHFADGALSPPLFPQMSSEVEQPKSAQAPAKREADVDVQQLESDVRQLKAIAKAAIVVIQGLPSTVTNPLSVDYTAKIKALGDELRKL